jgi:hypothetical protein
MCLYVLSFVLWCSLRFPHKQCLVRLYLQLFVGRVMSYLHYFCLFAYSSVQHILCCVFVFLRHVYSLLPGWSGLSIFYCPFGILLTFIYMWRNQYLIKIQFKMMKNLFCLCYRINKFCFVFNLNHPIIRFYKLY